MYIVDMKQTTTKGNGMYRFTKLESAKSFAAQTRKVSMVFHDEGGTGYVVAIGREADELCKMGHESIR